MPPLRGDDRRGAADQASLPAKGRGTCASAEILPAVTSGSSRAGLTVTVRNSPPKTARAPPVTGTSLPMELPRERAGPSHRGGHL